MRSNSWLKDAIIYQVYPQTFQDSNGDGIGDFQGLVRRLDYIQELGVDVIWLNPCFDSPFGDAGYDIRDFYKIAPRYGDEADLSDLVEAAHARGIKVILDLVAGHTSMDNPWFLEEAANPKSPEANRYIWKNRDFDPKLGPKKGDFVSNFFWYQPALNFGYAVPTEAWQDSVDAPGPQKNRAELRRIMAYWFDRGCDGFRVDMAGAMVKPSDPQALAETIRLWQEMRVWIDATYPDKLLFAEWSHPVQAINAGFDLDFIMHFNVPGYPSLFFNGVGAIPNKEGPCYFDREGRGSLEVFRKAYSEQLDGTRGQGFVSLPVANHDFQRLRCGARSWDELRCAWVFFMTQAGPPTIYYGEEIGMRYVEDAPAKEGSTLQGITAANAGTLDLGERAGTRTPMQWDDSDNAGFSTASESELYLPIDSDPERPTVAKQEADPNSLLHFVRELVRLRKSHPALGSEGSYTILNPVEQSYPMVYMRELNGLRYLIALNPSAVRQSISLAVDGSLGEFLLNQGCQWAGGQGMLRVDVERFSYSIVEVQTE
ncbi:alpha-amylase family glycosyl hydrolase [Coraliomargarita algicola]|uniref:Alpha-amylase family glycosyl hydrolase n=1 Tax=Coraliomargarita algicola TaxID=3092156 RepID=A0ABZ0RRK0_9BACT|nr:alpha-amylase family glycosyl hydrolase [Coraliomargarita sp. J2-16]WPJ97415.1 alpha-amylase family glycosyl hydrolase [Coraliomargarita sp. J2-16]